jgi:signal transduction histidine kinase
MVQDLLDYAQIKQGKFRKTSILFNIKDAVEEVMSIQKIKALDNKIKLHSSFEGACMVMTDKQRVMQVLLCLQSNALKFT